MKRSMTRTGISRSSLFIAEVRNLDKVRLFSGEAGFLTAAPIVSCALPGLKSRHRRNMLTDFT